MARSSPARSATNRPGWGCSRSDRAASRSPAAQPSVRRHSVSSSAPDSSTPWSASSAAVSSSEKARSASRTSVSWPATRSRCRASGGSARLATTRRSWAGACRSRNRSWPITAGPPASCRSSRISTTGRSSSSRPPTRARRNPSPISACGSRPASSPSGRHGTGPVAARPAPGPRTAAGAGRPGRPAPRPPGPAAPPPSAHEVSSRVLPYPARRGQQGQRPLGPLVQQAEQPLTGHRLPARHRHHPTGGEQRRRVVRARRVREQLPARPNPPLVLLLTARETVGGRDARQAQGGAIPCHWRSPSPASWRPRPTATGPTRPTCQDGRRRWSSPTWWPSVTGRCRPRSWPRRCGAGPSRPPGGRPSAGWSARSGTSWTCSACPRPTP